MTEHIEALKEEIAKTVIMPGDPMRAKYIAENYLDDYKLVNKVRGMYAYTGTYKDKLVTVMASGMGIPSMGIYSYELYNTYNVDNIIRIGTCGSYVSELKIHDLLLATSSFSESSYAKTQNGTNDNIMYSNEYLNEIIENTAIEIGSNINKCCIHSTDVFYKENNNYKKLVKKYGCKAVEMETFALFHNANLFNKRASAILSVSDSFITNEKTTSKDRETNLNKMIILALESSIKI